MQDKIVREQLSVSKFWATSGKATLNGCTRFGKTYVGIYLINSMMGANTPNASLNQFIMEYKKTNSNPPIIYVVVPSLIVKESWIEKLDKLCVYPNCYVVTTSELENESLEELSNIRAHLVILDEIHKLVTTDIGVRLIRNEVVTSGLRLGLTGTMPGPIGTNLIQKFMPVYDVVTEAEAIAKRWIAPYREYNIAVELNVLSKNLFIQLTKKIKGYTEKYEGCRRLFYKKDTLEEIFKSDFEILLACKIGYTINKTTRISSMTMCELLAEKYGWTKDSDNQEIQENYNPNVINDDAKSYSELILQRNLLMIKSPEKIELVLKILIKNPVPTIIFTGDTSTAEVIAGKINAYFENKLEKHVKTVLNEDIINYKPAVVYHSKLKSEPLIDLTTGKTIMTTTSEGITIPKKFGLTVIRTNIINGMNIGRYQFLVAVDALNEGMDLPVVRQIISTAGTTNPTTYKQKSGRGKTIDSFNPNKITNIINIYIDDIILDGAIISSRDKSKLRARQVDSSPYYISSIDEIL